MVTHEEEILCDECQKNRLSWSKLLSSKTFWFATLVILSSLLTGFSNLEIIAQYPHIASFLGVLIGTITLLLRVLTTGAVTTTEVTKKECKCLKESEKPLKT